MAIRLLIAALVVVVGGGAGFSYWQLQNYEGTRTTHEVMVDATAEQVWDHLIDPKKRSNWVTGLVTVVPLWGTPGKAGARSLLVMLQEGQRFEVEEEIIGAEPGAWLGLKTTSLGSILTTTFTLEAAGPDGAPKARTLVTFEQDTYHLTWQGKLFAPFLRLAANANAENDLERLKIVVEKPDQA